MTELAEAPTRTTVQVLSLLRSRGVKLWTEGEKLRYSAPPGALTPELLIELRERKAELLGFLRQGHVARRSGAPSRIEAAHSERPPLSFAQQRLWLLHQLFPEGVEYNVARAVRLRGQVRVDLLAASLREIVRRHGALRTTFAVDDVDDRDGQPVQVVAPELELPLPLVDLTDLPSARREAEAWWLAQEDAALPFDLARGPLLRVFLLRLDAEDFIAPSTMHHVISDGWSSGILFREMGLVYGALARGVPPALPPLPVQYVDFAVWQRQWLTGEVLAEQLAWWKEQLAGAPPELDLPTDRPRSGVRSARGDRRPLLIPPPLTESLRELGQAHGATLFMVLLAAWQTLLCRVSGQDDVVTGSPIANRNRTEIEGLIGCFVNTLVLRTVFPGDPTFHEVLAEVRKTTLGAYAHQDLPFEKIVEELRPERSLTQTPLFQVIFTLQNVPSPEMEVADFRMTLMPPTRRAAMVDLACNMKEMPEGVRTSFMYKEDLFDGATIARLAAHYLRLLEAVAADPGQRIRELPLLAPAEERQLLEWGGIREQYGSGDTLATLFEAQVRQAPEARAVTCDGTDLTYAELNRRADQLAQWLRQAGVRSETRVGLSVGRSLDLIVGMLGIVKAGGAYVPLDPGYPQERLAFLAEDAGVRVVVGAAPHPLAPSPTPSLPPGEGETGCEFVNVGLWQSPPLPVDGWGWERGLGGEGLAYVIYTSGSTGRPKGVQVTHANVVRLLHATQPWLNFGPGDVWTLFHSSAFDFSVWEIWGALLTGGRLVVVPWEVSRTPEAFHDLLVAERVTVLNQTPTAFGELMRVDEDREGELTDLRLVIFGGEALVPSRLAPWFARYGDGRPRLVNMYGITETTVHVTYRPLTSADERSVIGIPIPDLAVHVLDRGGRLAPIGVPGELAVGGAGLARGYLGRPDLTAERFVPDPFSGPGARLYRSGDLGRFLPSGELEYLGRIDQQVKIRGFRIEPGEIEAALLAHPDVREAVVLVRENSLAAYVVLDRTDAKPALAAWLRDRLPQYMLPSAFVRLDALPLTTNGKVDRKALLALGEATQPADAFVAPRTPAEELVASLFAEVLNVETVGAEGHFFELGGHSLLATQVMSRLRQTFGVELPLRTLFEEPTVAGLARIVGAVQGAAPPPSIVPVPRDAPLPLSFAQQRLWFIHQLEPHSPSYNIPAAVRLTGALSVPRLARVFAGIARRHEVLRTTFASPEGRPVQVIHPQRGDAELPVVDLSALPVAAREVLARRLAEEESLRPFDLRQGPLWRTALLRLGAREHLLLLTLHHVISDGWSMGLLVREVQALDRGLPLPELPIQYADFAVWQRQWLAGEVLERQLAWWRAELSGAPGLLELPTDRPRSGARGSSGNSIPLHIPRPLAEALQRLGRAEGATLFMVLLTVWKTLLGRVSGQDDLVVGSPIANRNRTEIEGLIGCFVNTLALRTVFAGDPTVRELLAAVRATTLGAYAHQDLPFEKIVEELRPERSLTHTPLFQVIFTLQNVPTPDLEADGFRMTLLPPASRAAMFDLACSLRETPEGVRASLLYQEDLFDGATVERLAGGYLRLLEAVAADPGQTIRELPLLSPAEQQQLLEWGGIREQHTPGDTLATLFEAKVREAPGARAVTCEGRDLTYGELNAQADRLAGHLRRLGVGPEVPVGLSVERSLELIVGMLGIVKAGGAYVPLDPAYPRERLAFLVEDAGVRVMVGPEGIEEVPPLPGGCECGWERGLGGEGLAYVIYTSGSTGKPKGVQVTHANVLRLLHATQPWFGFGPEDVWTLFHSSAFDFSVWEIWGALLTGGRLVVVPWEVTRTPEAFHDLLVAERVTVLNQTPTAFGELLRVDEDREGDLTDLRLVIFGGEALVPARLAPWFARYGDGRPRLVNMYGITETTVHVTYRPLTSADERSVIGIPIPDLSVHVLDRGGRLAPIGVAGELAVGGAGLARGYLGRPDLTAERFVPDPFSGPGTRLYRSGDLGRFLPSGELEYLGRIDQQVKIRGFRIEPGEVEAALLAHPEVREAVVLVKQDRLVAYVVLDRTDPTDPTDRSDQRPALAAWLRDRLPQYMLPSAFVRLDALPLTANGKVDRKALLALGEAAQPADTFVAPRTPAEELVASIFAEVLRVEGVGAEAHFFELGGHSLLATQVVSRVRQALGVEVPLRTLFEEPTVAGLARAVAQGQASSAPPLLPVPRTGDLPLSFAQQRLWLIDQLEPDSPVYNLFSAVRLFGPARPGDLQARLEAVVSRHETLRTTFAQHGGQPVQIVHSSLPPDIAAIDLTALAPAARDRELLRLAQAELLRPFDLANGPLVRARFVTLGAEESAALLVMHHIVSDEWSMRVLVEELCGASATLPELPVQYADYAVWQRGWLRGETLAAELAFWREHLAGVPELLALPTDRPRPAVQSFRGTSSGQHLPAELAGALRATARTRSATLFMIYLTAFQTLLGRITGEREIVIGTPIAGRNRLETERLIGFFVNTLALRASLPGRPSLGDLLARTRETVLAAHAHQDLPFELLVEELNPRRSLSHTPLFQVMMNLGTATNRLELPGVSIAPLDGPRSGIAPFDLTLSIADTEERTRLVFESSTDLFDASTVERLHGYLRQVLQALAATPEAGLHEVELWGPAERHQVLTEWNDTAAGPVPGTGLHGHFEAWARERPGAPAVFFEGGSWSFAELDGRAERLARHLRGLGVGAETVVGLLAAGSPELALGMLGVLKAGGAFLPLDPRWPVARRAELLEDAGARVLLTQEDLEDTEASSLESLESLQSWGATAYVFYTSGSTGRPKGVMVGHGAAVSMALEVAARCGLGAEDRFLQFASPGFDVLIEEVFPVWARGGAVVFAPQEELLTPAGLERVLERHGVTSLELPTPYWNEWADDLERRGDAPPRSVRRLLLGSEKPSVERLARWDRHGIPVFHVFGLTETAVTSTIHRWNGNEPAAREVPIGRPVGNTSLYVLDREGAPVPRGVAGELFIGGGGVARGYLGRPERTAERFVPDPFGATAGARAYRTGDLARYRTDGSLDFLGRIDEQVKVRGVRIEPGEIEVALLAHPAVRDAVIVVRDHRLVAYAVLDQTDPTDPTDRSDLHSGLAAWLRDRLPQYMLPSAFVLLHALPRTANGKIDRAALPVPDRETERGGEAPRTPVEELLAGIWGEVLGRPAVGREEDFFALGGHSLLATQVVSRVRQALGVELPLRSLFEAPTVAGLARAVAQALQGDAPAPPPLVPVERGGDLPLSFAQRRLWFIDQLDPGGTLYNIPVALRIEGPLDAGVLALCLGEIVRRHEALRTVFATQRGEPVQVVQPAEPFLLPLVDLSRLPDCSDLRAARHARTLSQEEAGWSFDLTRGPLLRGVLLRLAEEDHILALTMHHIVSDAWSMGILVREVTTLYAAFANGRPSPLADLPVQYADFAVWQGSWLRGEILEREISFWRQQLAGLPPLLALPTDRPRPAVQSSRGALRRMRLPAGLTRQAHALARREGATLFMVLLAGFQALLARTCGQDDLAVGTPIAGRNRVEIEGLIGFFVNTLVLRGDLSAEPTFRELLGRVRAATLAAYTHQDVPFEKLVEELAPERSLAHTPLFQVMFTLQNAPVESLEIPGLRLRPVGGEGTMAMFDLTLSLEAEQEGELAGGLEYATDLFDAPTIVRLAVYCERLLVEALATPDLPVAALPLLTGAERHQLLVEWNDTAELLPEECLHHSVAAQAARRPSAVAVELGSETWDETWTWRRLLGSARRLARHLRTLGVGPDVVVGLCAERSPVLVLGMLAVLEAGGALLPLEAAHPPERLGFLLEDSDARVLLIQEPLLDRVPAGGRPVVLLDGRWDAGEEIGEPLRVDVFPDHLALVLYTSGSTGRPKGVMLPHRGLANRLRWARQAYGIDERDVFLQKASVGFDASLWECFGALTAGARLVLAEPGRQADGAYLVRAIREHRVTLVDFVPAMLAAFVAGEDVETCESLRQIFVGGEALSPELRDLALDRLAIPLDNMYGPTEISIDTTRQVCAPGQSTYCVPIGRPIANSRLSVVDRELRPVAIGVAGELLVGGTGVTRGYLRRPDLTADRYIPDPFGAQPGGRVYRTGDLARWLPDGALDFLGRVDDQVKIRGIRIELGEVEQALVALPGVREAVVMARPVRSEGGGGDLRLVAYLVSEMVGNVVADTRSLREQLRERLPDAMVPAEVVELPALPRTISGKIDRAALPVPKRETCAGGEGPRTPVEELLAGIWGEVLARPPVGRDEDFFDLGGHSLLATRVVSRIRGVLGVDLPLRALFEAPTVAGLARAVEAGRGAALPPPLVPVPRDPARPDLPLSFAQQRLWLIDQMEPDSAAYNVPIGLRLGGALEPALLARIFAEVVRRHEVLRTTFAQRADRPVQIVAHPESASPELPLVDLSHLPETEREAAARALACEEGARPFDLRRGPLLGLLLVRLDARDHLLLVTLHHIVSDGWSAGILVREVAALHAAFSKGQASPLPELPVQYADFAVWQREWLQGGVLEEQLATWRRRLAGAPQVLDLPTDRPRPVAQTFHGARRPVALPAGLAAAVREVSRREGATLFMTLLAAWAAVLGRHAGQDDLLVGAPVAGRNRQETEGLIGFFVNTLVLRADLSGAPSFAEVLRRVREEALDAFTHQDLPFERLVEEVVAQRDLARSPLIQVLFSLEQNVSEERLEIPGLTLAALADESRSALFELVLSLDEGPEGIAGTLEHNTGLFDGATADRLAARFAVLLAGAVADPGRALPDLPLLLPAELEQVLWEWNDTRRDYPRQASLPELFAEVAREHPGAPAIVAADGEVWTYRRLDEESARLAGHLRSLGVGLETPVGIAMERSPELILGTLAILRAGGVYVPLDPGYPDERLAFMLADTGARIVLVHERTRERMAALDSALVEVGAKDALPLPSLESLPSLGVGGHRLAYVIYTSGSTGRPKGVAVPHQAIVRLVRETDYVQLGRGDRVAHLSNTSFDAATFEIWGALLNGAALVVVPREVVLVPADFAALLRRERVTALFLTTALFNQVVRDAPGAFATVRHALVGGDAVDPGAVARALEQEGPERLLNAYGPTESTTFAAWHHLREVPPGATTLPIGLPLANTTLYVLDRWLRPVPPGVIGELFIGGDGLARGYWNRPELTAERFIPDEWTRGGRLYRTGDLVRRRTDGPIELLGRRDNQVKIRGFRIEPGEIEAMLLTHPDVREAVVLPLPDAAGGRRLVAWVAGRPASDLRAWLQERLPGYMVPSAFVAMEALPLTPNGKVDRRALPAPETALSAADSPAAMSTIEELLAGIWAEVLGTERVGLHDDFFALGGHSLLATQVMSRIRDVLGVELPLRRLFESPTVSGLAREVRGAPAARAAGSSIPPLVPVTRGGDLPLSFAQQRLWLIDQLDPDRPTYNLPMALRLTGAIAPALLARIFAEIIRRHEALRTTFDVRAGLPVQVIAPPGRPAPPAVVDLERLPEPEREAAALTLAREEARRPFDLRRGPLLRLALLRLGATDHVLLLNLHHVVSDGWSMGVLVREIAALYPAFAQGLPSPLPELAVQYADFAVWQRSWMQGAVLQGELDHWRRRLDGAPGVLELPTDRPRPAAQTFRGALVPVVLSPALSQGIRELCRREGVTPFMVLLAGWALLLGRLAGQEEVLVGSPIAGRNRREIEDLIGFFVNTLVLRVTLSRDGEPAPSGSTFRELLRQVHETALDAFAHQDVPFERLVEDLAPERDLAQSPLVQVLFGLQSAPLGVLSVPGLAMAPVDLDGGSAKLDLTLSLAEGPDGFSGNLEHNTDLFDGATVERLAAGFVALLEGAVAEPGRALHDLPLGAGDLVRRRKDGGGHPVKIRGFRSEAPATRNVAAPTNPLEEGLAAIWADVLQLDRFGIDDDFFALGGHSLLATQVVTRVREELGLELPLRRVFEEPTIRRLARSLAPPLALAVRLSGALSVEILERTLGEWARRRGAAAPGLPVLDLSDAPEEAREEWARQLALEEARHPFDPEGGPGLRLGLLRLGEREHLLLVTPHPGLAQGASESELRDQIETLSQRAVEQDPSGASHGPPAHIPIFSYPGERTTMDLTTRLLLAFYRARGRFRQALSAWAERQDRRELAAFYRGLERREDIIYMFFTTDLLHWLDRALAFVPPEVDVVLIGSDLTADEISWIRSHYRRPFHHIRSRVDDITVMEFVFQMAEHNFGWLHVDCFVLNPSLFAEMAAVDEDVVANCIWSHPMEGSPATALHSAFVFFNFAVIQKLRASGIEVSPSTYNYSGGPKGRTITHRKLYNRVPTPRHIELLGRVLPPGLAGLPEYPLRDGYFQVMVLYQLVANALGYRLHHVRELLRDGTGSAQSFSNEIVHVNGVATYKRYKDAGDTLGGRFYALLLQADYVLLAGLGDEAPPRYRQLRGELEAELERLHIPKEAVRRNLRAFLAERGIGEDRLNRIVGPAGRASTGEPTEAADAVDRASAGGTIR